MLDVGEDELLVRALGTSGGSAVVRLVSKRLKKNVGEVDVVLPTEREAAFEQVRTVLTSVGDEVDPPAVQDGDQGPIVRVVARGGTGGLNPVVVTAAVTSAEPERTRLHVRAAAKEGLIKQRAGEKLVERIQGLLATGS